MGQAKAEAEAEGKKCILSKMHGKIGIFHKYKKVVYPVK